MLSPRPMILARVLRRHLRQQVTIAYGGIIGRAENQEMVRTLDLKLSQLRYVNWKNYRHFALVDSQPRTGNHQLPDNIVPTLVLDHHPPRKASSECAFADIRTDYGATASIAAEYMLAAELPVSRRVATAVVYAIRSETLDFSREQPGPDRALHDHFLGIADKRALGRIQNPPLPLDYFKTLHDALESLEGVGSLILCHLGRVPQPDIVPEIADMLLRLEGRTWSLCTGQYEDRIYCSIRTSNARANAAGVMRRLLGRRGKGGGHGMIAGGWAEVSNGADPRKVQLDLGRRLAHLLRKNPDRICPIAFVAKGAPS